ncbi:MAG TPA: hypothetical protein DCO72_06945 [Ruminococcus sp.]|nr:hypothetical protein [Ruminococcus sp.]
MILNEQEEIYFVYAKKPTIQYMYEKPEGGFEPITVFERNGVTFTRTSNAVTQNPIAQEELLPVTADGLLISQISTPSSRAFEIPGDLDYDGKQLRIDLNRLCVGENIANAQDTGSKSMKITLTPDGKMQYSANGTAVSFPENPVVYAIYRIKGYELTVSKQVKGNSTVGNFTFEISSDVLSGEYATSTGTPVTASDKKITITVPRDGSVTIYGLSKGTYVVTETTPGDYEMTAKVNGIDMNVTATKVAALVESNTTVAVLNTYPIPVTGVGERTAPYVVVMILTTAALVCIYRRKEEKQNENSSL